MLTSRITEGGNRHFKTNTDHHNGDLKLRFFVFFLVVVSFAHFKWLTFKELSWLIIIQY